MERKPKPSGKEQSKINVDFRHSPNQPIQVTPNVILQSMVWYGCISQNRLIRLPWSALTVAFEWSDQLLCNLGLAMPFFVTNRKMSIFYHFIILYPLAKYLNSSRNILQFLQFNKKLSMIFNSFVVTWVQVLVIIQTW